MDGGISAKIDRSEAEQGSGRPSPFLLDMHKRPGELDQTLVKHSIWPVFVLEPKLFQDVMGFKELSAIKAFEKTQVIRTKPIN